MFAPGFTGSASAIGQQGDSRIQVNGSFILADEGDDTLLPEIASVAKAKVCETIKLVTNEAIQLFGGIGMTDEEEIGFFLKRARVAQQTFGDKNYHVDRFATLKGY